MSPSAWAIIGRLCIFLNASNFSVLSPNASGERHCLLRKELGFAEQCIVRLGTRR